MRGPAGPLYSSLFGEPVSRSEAWKFACTGFWWITVRAVLAKTFGKSYAVLKTSTRPSLRGRPLAAAKVVIIRNGSSGLPI